MRAHAVDGQLLLAPGGHAAVEVAGDLAQADGAGERRGLERVLVVAPDEHERLAGLRPATRAWSRSPARRAVMLTRARDVRLVELQLGAHVDDERALVAGLLDLARRERVRVDGLLDQRAAVERDDRAEVRRLRPERRDRALDELVLVGDLQQLLVRALEADRRGDLQVHARPAAHASRRGGRARPRSCRAASAAAPPASGRCRARPPPCRRRGRAARCRRRTACRRSAPPTAPRRARGRRARTPCARAGGRACAARARPASPSSSSQPSSNGSCS